ncbi:MAG: GNAT family acetyltransferase [Planctomycetota bacterium]|jgi:ribosomal protein S18 acetylase RimI-like enzyme
MAESDVEIRPYESADRERVVALWHECGLAAPWNDPEGDIELKLRVRPELFLVGLLEGQVVATAMAGYDGHRGWINYLAVSAKLRRRGIGRAMIQEAEQRLRRLGCPKVNVQIRTSNSEAVAFYKRIGFDEEERVSMGKRLDGR